MSARPTSTPPRPTRAGVPTILGVILAGGLAAQAPAPGAPADRSGEELALPAPREDRLVRVRPPARTQPADLALENSLWRIWRSRDLPLEELRERAGIGFHRIDDARSVHVEILGPEGAAAVDDSLLARHDARAEGRFASRVDAWVPVESLVRLARDLPAGYRVERAAPGEPDDVVGEGPAATGSEDYRDEGADGTGLVIAVIDADYAGLTAAQNNGDAPSNPTIRNFTTQPFQNTSAHGTGCLEAIFDHCPGATYRLYKTDSLTDLQTAVNECISNGVDVITRSVSDYNLGWFDDQGAACAAANAAGQAGILFFASAGNRARQHWQGTFNAGLGASDFHDWTTGDELLAITMSAGDRINFYLSWNASGPGNDDYDLFLFDSTGSSLLASSTNGGENYEAFSYTNNLPGTVTVNLAVQKLAGSAPAEIEVFGHTGGTVSWEWFTQSSSTTSPSNATNTNVISVGAVTWSNFGSPNGTTGLLAGYSSQGPTNSGRRVPDLVGPTDTTALNYPSGFGGTSCATPNTAGTAGALWSSEPAFAADAIRWLLVEQAEHFADWGGAGPGNSYGAGGAFLWPHETGTTWLSRDYLNVGNLPTGPLWTLSAAEQATPNGGTRARVPGRPLPRGSGRPQRPDGDRVRRRERHLRELTVTRAPARPRGPRGRRPPRSCGGCRRRYASRASRSRSSGRTRPRRRR